MENEVLDSDFYKDGINKGTIEYADFGGRFLATLVDALVFLPIIGLNFLNLINVNSLIIALILQTLAFLYKPFMEGKYGATLGKKACRIKVLDTNLNAISMKDSFIRNFPWLISYIIGLITTIGVYFSGGFENIDNFMAFGIVMEDSPMNTISQIYNFIFLGIIGSLIFDKQKQGLHDKLANTLCIKTQ